MVLLAVIVTAEGWPARVEILQSSGFGLLDSAALGAVKRWRFSPARKGDAAVDCEVEVPIDFKLMD
jgi:protein TonB